MVEPDVQSLKVNGKQIKRAFLYHDEIGYGATVEFGMGKERVDWSGEGEGGGVPPSLSTGGLVY